MISLNSPVERSAAAIPTESPSRLNRAQKIVARSIEQIIGVSGARSDRLDRLHGWTMPFANFGSSVCSQIDTETLLNESPQVFAGCFYRHACQRHFARAAVVSRGEREAERSGCDFCILVEHLVEVAHPEKQNRVLMTRP